MRNTITQKLCEIEKAEQVRILLAVESGSRAWGFASPDSDYDVRLIYVRARSEYLRLDKTRDVIEYPINDLLDINGWDLDKTLRLLHKSNPTLFEWFSSPIVYMETSFAARFRVLMADFFSSKSSLWHYLSMAESNYREYLRGDMVKAKKYFYVLRPILACRWILDKGSPPPMAFSVLAQAELPLSLTSDIEKLLDLKVNSPEIKQIPKINVVNDYLDSSIIEIKDIIRALPEEKACGWEPLNDLFFSTVGVN
jgi:predicted nucleotidyltransferase